MTRGGFRHLYYMCDVSGMAISRADNDIMFFMPITGERLLGMQTACLEVPLWKRRLGKGAEQCLCLVGAAPGAIITYVGTYEHICVESRPLSFGLMVRVDVWDDGRG